MSNSSLLALRPNTDPKTDVAPRQLNGIKNGSDDHDFESELSDPDSNVPSPLGEGGITGLEDEIVVSARVHGNRKSPANRIASDHNDVTMVDAVDEPSASPYPKRKRNLTYVDLAESNIENADVHAEKTPPLANIRQKPTRAPVAKHVIVGYWRDSDVPDPEHKHAVVGFIDVRDRLRTRIQPFDRAGESLAAVYPLPPGPGGSWVTFERVAFDDHLVGLDHVQVKEYVRIMAEGGDDPRLDRNAAVKEAIRRIRENPLHDNPTVQPAIAYGAEIPSHAAAMNRPDLKRVAGPDNKRRRVSAGFTPVNNGPNSPANGITPTQHNENLRQPSALDPLDGTRPTRILLGCWTKSEEPEERDRHAVYGILSQNEMFRVKLVRETRDGRYVDGNFPLGAGGLWIQWDEVAFDSHLKGLDRNEIKEYCRIRQYQLDHGESPEERRKNEEFAVKEAKLRASLPALKLANNAKPQALAPAAAREGPEADESIDQPEDEAGLGGQELQHPRRALSRVEPRPTRHSLNEAEHPAGGRGPRGDALERTAALAQREIARIEAAQGRADRNAGQRERAAAAATTASSPDLTNGVNGKVQLHETADLQRLNEVWARQENLRMRATSEDAKIYCGIKYERKTTGPFMGKLVSQGTIINIDDEDYVEYRVLTKPSFF
ncbi:hypothetical protein S40288_03188 [Stachybotrys chartarum IBT 40288]|nr:hypothetical protein S40288_03188 [Stachybotrys chartarum IBT 40288]